MLPERLRTSPACTPHTTAGYNSYFARSYGVCDNPISMECLNTMGGDLCLAAALAPFIRSATDAAGARGVLGKGALEAVERRSAQLVARCDGKGGWQVPLLCRCRALPLGPSGRGKTPHRLTLLCCALPNTLQGRRRTKAPPSWRSGWVLGWEVRLATWQ